MNLRQMLERQRELLNTAQAEGRSLNEAESAEFETLQRQIDEMINTPQESEMGEPPAGEEQGRNVETPPAQQVSSGDDAVAAAQRAVAEERQRVNEITELCRGFALDPAPYIRDGRSVEETRKLVLDELKKNHGPVNVRVGDDGRDSMIDDMTDALLMRGNVSVKNPSSGAAGFAGAKIKDIAAYCLSREDSAGGKNYYMMDASELFSETIQRQFFNPTAAFPAMLDNTVRKAYVEGHRTAPVTFDHFTTKGSLSDFKVSENLYVAGNFGEFLEVPEGGELKHFTPVDTQLPKRQLKTYGRKFTMSRQAFINDDIGVITRLPAKAAAAARTTINKHVYSILVNNPKIYDGKNLFAADHKNLIKTGTGITQDAVQSMILALGGHRDANGDAVLISPGYMVVPLGYKFAMYTLFNSATIDQNGTVNPLQQYRDSIEIVEDATINAMAGTGAIPWFMIGDKAYTSFIQVDYLNGQEIPNIRRSEVAGQLGFIWDVYGDWGITVLDYMGAVKNPGVTITSPLATA